MFTIKRVACTMGGTNAEQVDNLRTAASVGRKKSAILSDTCHWMFPAANLRAAPAKPVQKYQLCLSLHPQNAIFA